MRNIAVEYKSFFFKYRTLKDKLRLTKNFKFIKTEKSENDLVKNFELSCAEQNGCSPKTALSYNLWNKSKVLVTPAHFQSHNETEIKHIKNSKDIANDELFGKSEAESILSKPLKWKYDGILKNTRNKDRFLQYTAGAAVLSIVSDDTRNVVESIPEPPPIPDASAEALNQLNTLGEPTLASLGLGGWSPVGLVQTALEYLHVSLDLPWWGTIAIGTVIVRLLMFPLVVIAQRNAAKMNNYLPQMQVLQLKMTEARQTGNHLDVARYSQEMMLFMKEKGLNPLKNMIVPLAQMPLFISFFMGLRQMANVPVESMRHGGILWFEDLCVPDQYFILPIITSMTLWATIELGTDSAKLSAQNMQVMKYVLRAMPAIILPFTINFPGAILCYWVSSNFISLAQVGFLKIPAVRDYFRIEPTVAHKSENLPIKSKGFVGGIKDSWTNIKVTKEIEERQRFDELQFRKAGKGPIVKTYKFDPTKNQPQEPVINAKKR